jgi:hypothetical protein
MYFNISHYQFFIAPSILYLKRIQGCVMALEGNLIEENSCVLNRIYTFQFLFPLYLKVESNNFLMMM